MCGIAGLTGPGARELVLRMRETLAHRGPDGSGVFADERLALGHRRLSIIDLSPAAAQPFASDDGSLQLVFNGEIYNYVELRDELRAKGRAFRTSSDTEVLVRGYEEWGEGVLARLNGMFALGLYDQRARRLLLARDRAGEKPLHFGWLDVAGTRRFAFASELRALLALARPAPSPLGVARYLAYEYLPAPSSVLEGLEKLAGGEALSLDLETLSTRRFRYWEPRFLPKLALSFEEAKERLKEALIESVRIRLRSDVPLGVFLSGGVDSSTVAALARALLPGSELRTFSIGFEEASFDESSHARAVARHLGTRHSEKTLSEKELLATLPRVLAHQDEPLADSSIVPTWLLSELARSEVTVVLGGDGGDELFCGYDPFKAWSAARAYSALVPSFLHRGVVRPLVELLPSGEKKMALDFKVKRFLRGAVAAPSVRVQAWLGAFEPAAIGALLHEDLASRVSLAEVYEPTERAWQAAKDADDVDRQAAVYFATYLQDGVLQKVDRASMAHALETRAPFLDPAVIELAFALPSAHRYDALKTKRVLKALARELVPREVIDRPKQGFGIPLARWLRGPLAPLVRETLAPERVREGRLLDPDAVSKLVAENEAGKADPRQVWTVLVLEAWRQRWLEFRSP